VEPTTSDPPSQDQAAPPPSSSEPAPAAHALPAPPPAWWLLLLFLAMALPLAFLFIVLGAALGEGRRTLLALLATQLAFLLPALAWARLSGYRPLRLLGLVLPTRASMVLGLGIGVGAIVAGSGLMALWRLALPGSLLARFDLGHDLMTQGWSPALLLGVAALLPALCEEIAFRGALQASLLRGRTPARAVGIGAVVFAAAHFDPVRFPGVLLVGLAFGWLAWRTGSLWPSMLAHAVNNGAAVLVYLLAGEAEAADPAEALAAPEAVLVLAFGLSLLALAVTAARRWLPPAPEAESFLVARAREAAPGGAAPRAPTTAGEAPSPSGTAPP